MLQLLKNYQVIGIAIFLEHFAFALTTVVLEYLVPVLENYFF